jgi:hypothetical protein
MQIHIQRDGEKFGPYSEEEARQYLREGSLLPDDLAWHEGLENWVALNTLVPELSVKRTPPPPSKFPAKTARSKHLSPWVAYGIPLGLILGIIFYVRSLWPEQPSASVNMGIFNPTPTPTAALPSTPSAANSSDPKGDLTRELAAQLLNQYLAKPHVARLPFTPTA